MRFSVLAAALLATSASTCVSYIVDRQTQRPFFRDMKAINMVVSKILEENNMAPEDYLPWKLDSKPPLEVHYFHKNETKFDGMKNSKDGFRALLPTFKLRYRENDLDDLKKLLEQDGHGKVLILGGGHAPTLVKALAPIAATMRDAVEVRGWKILGDCAGAFGACKTFTNYHGQEKSGLNLVDVCARPFCADRPDLKHKMMTAELQICEQVEYFSNFYVVSCDAPVFLFFDEAQKKRKTLARYSASSALYPDEPAVVAIEKGRGLVVLCAVHFESVYLRAHELSLQYKTIIEENPDISSSVVVKMMWDKYYEGCPLLEDMTPVKGCLIGDPLNIAINWVLICSIFNSMIDHDLKVPMKDLRP